MNHCYLQIVQVPVECVVERFVEIPVEKPIVRIVEVPTGFSILSAQAAKYEKSKLDPWQSI